MRPSICIVVAVIAIALFESSASAQASAWVGTWASPPVQLDTKHDLSGQTLRQILRTSVSGPRVRITLSNLFGNQPLRVEDVHIALPRDHGSINPVTDRKLHFHGNAFTVIPPGEAIQSDPAEFPVPQLADIAVSIYIPAPAESLTFHPSAHRTSYAAKGDVSAAEALTDARPIESYYLLTNVDVDNASVKGAVVTLGASITEGHITTPDTNRAWPSVLAERLQQNGQNIAVLNAGISGNRLLTDGAGPKALDRFDRDVLSQSGVRWVIFSDDPVNDLGSTRPLPTAEALIGGLKQLIQRAHAKNIQFFCSTLTPFEGANYWIPAAEPVREQIDAFIRSSQSGCDGVIDQDATLHDPAHPSRYLPAYDNGDHLHPNDAGHRATADAVDLSLFQKTEQSAR